MGSQDSQRGGAVRIDVWHSIDGRRFAAQVTSGVKRTVREVNEPSHACSRGYWYRYVRLRVTFVTAGHTDGSDGSLRHTPNNASSPHGVMALDCTTH